MRNKDEIKQEIEDCRKRLRHLQDNPPTDPNEYIAMNSWYYDKLKLANRIDTLFWVLRDY